MKRIDDDIKNNDIKRVYLLYGEEDYLLKQYRDRLKKAIAGDDMMNYTYYEGRATDIPALIENAETLPFFAERRLIVMENSGLFKSGDGGELSDYLKEAPDTTYFVFAEAEVDKRSRLYKTCGQMGVIVEFKRQDDMTLKRWVAMLLKRDGKKMTERDIEHFLSLTGNDMVNIKNELEKLICYTGDREIVTAKDADTITTRQLENHIFDMVSAMGNRQQDKALKLYYELLSLKEAPLGILRLIVRQFNLLLQTRELMGLNKNKYDIGERIGLPHFIADKYMAQARRFDVERLKEALLQCADAEFDVKSGRMSDRMAIELIIVEFSR